MWDFTLRQAGANGLPVCLARDAERGEYFDPETGSTRIAGIPRAGILPPGELVAVEAIPETPELRARAEALRAYQQERNGPGTVGVVGDPLKGGRRANLDELVSMRKPQPGEIPAGLARCEACGEWRGECMDFRPREILCVARVHCRCENRNRCAGCGRLLGERKLNSNQYSEADGNIWHYGGALALAHRC